MLKKFLEALKKSMSDVTLEIYDNVTYKSNHWGNVARGYIGNSTKRVNRVDIWHNEKNNSIDIYSGINTTLDTLTDKLHNIDKKSGYAPSEHVTHLTFEQYSQLISNVLSNTWTLETKKETTSNKKETTKKVNNKTATKKATTKKETKKQA